MTDQLLKTYWDCVRRLTWMDVGQSICVPLDEAGLWRSAMSYANRSGCASRFISRTMPAGLMILRDENRDWKPEPPASAGREVNPIARKMYVADTVRYKFDWSRMRVGDWFIARGGSQTKAANRSLLHTPMVREWAFDTEPHGRVSTKFTRIA